MIADFLSVVLMLTFVILNGYWLQYALRAMFQKKWNNLFYGICILAIMWSKLEFATSFMFAVLVILLHAYIDYIENEDAKRD